jgi:hypothetical protein
MSSPSHAYFFGIDPPFLKAVLSSLNATLNPLSPSQLPRLSTCRRTSWVPSAAKQSSLESSCSDGGSSYGGNIRMQCVSRAHRKTCPSVSGLSSRRFDQDRECDFVARGQGCRVRNPLIISTSAPR